MKFLLFSLVIVMTWICLCGASSLSEFHWMLFKNRHGKVYTSLDEESMRKTIFMENKRKVDHHNAFFAQKLGYEMELNHFSDMTQGELNALTGRYSETVAQIRSARTDSGKNLNRLVNDLGGGVPDQLDWRKVSGRVSEVKNPAGCFASWDVVAAEVLEGQELSRNVTHQLRPLSVQNLIDCSSRNSGCSKGYVGFALADIADMGGIQDEQSYPYTATKGKCRFDVKKSIMADTGFYVPDSDDEENLKSFSANFGPVPVHICVSDKIFSYKSGVFYDDSCLPCKQIHVVLVVGYGTDPKLGDYWILVSKLLIIIG